MLHSLLFFPPPFLFLFCLSSCIVRSTERGIQFRLQSNKVLWMPFFLFEIVFPFFIRFLPIQYTHSTGPIFPTFHLPFFFNCWPDRSQLVGNLTSFLNRHKYRPLWPNPASCHHQLDFRKKGWRAKKKTAFIGQEKKNGAEILYVSFQCKLRKRQLLYSECMHTYIQWKIHLFPGQMSFSSQWNIYLCIFS